ncbi:MAG: glycosyltransferase [Parvularculaceae bacterium]|nr:glycosyltransferase [Parvularculaceae bacterium]
MMRILLIARHYPPAVSGGARRPYLLARELRALGHEIFVIAPALPEGEPGVVAPHANRDPATLSGDAADGMRDVLREWLLWPDPDIRWSMRAATAAAEAAPWTPDWIWTTSPPESIHSAGLALKRKTGARWLADFRDHWLDRPHRLARSAPHRKIGESLVARFQIPRADLITCVDGFVADEMRGFGARDPRVLPHFSPPDMATPVALPAEDVNLVHSGSISLSDPEADIEALLAPFEEALRVNPRLRLHFVGRLTDAEGARARASPAGDRIVLHGVRSLPESLGMQHAADALALIGSPKTRVPPSKIVEYLATTKPIVVCGEGGWLKDERLRGALTPVDIARLEKGGTGQRPVLPPTARQAAETLAVWLNEPPARY